MDDPSISTLFGRAVTEARSLASAEVALAKAKLGERVVAYRGAATFFAVAAVLALCGFIALLVGAIMTLATVIGPGFATLAVFGVVMILAGIFALIGKRRLKPSVAA